VLDYGHDTKTPSVRAGERRMDGEVPRLDEDVCAETARMAGRPAREVVQGPVVKR
jgi:hypothetical protein